MATKTLLSNPIYAPWLRTATGRLWFGRLSAIVGLLCAAILAGIIVLAPMKTASADAGSPEAEQLVQEFVDTGLILLDEGDLTLNEQADRFRQLFKRYFAVKAIARWVLGRYARKATPEEKTEYLALFEDLIVYGYVKRFSEYSGQEVRVVRSVVENERTSTVFSEVVLEGDPTVFNVAWRVSKREDQVRITDVIVENASLAQTWRSDFSSTIRAEGGEIEGLLGVLRERVQGLKDEFAAG